MSAAVGLRSTRRRLACSTGRVRTIGMNACELASVSRSISAASSGDMSSDRTATAFAFFLSMPTGSVDFRGFVHKIPEVRRYQVGVSHCGSQIRVTHGLLDLHDVLASREPRRNTSMPKIVRTPGWVDLRPPGCG